MPTPSPGAIVLGTIAVMVPLVASGRVPAAIVALGATLALHTFGLLTLLGDRTVLFIGGLFIVSAALDEGVVKQWRGNLALADQFASAARLRRTADELVGSGGTMMLFAVLFPVTPLLTQAISSTATVLIVIPIALAVAKAGGAATQAALICVAVAAAPFLTPVASGANMMVKGPAVCRFGDRQRLGLPLLLWFFLVAALLVPVLWHP